MEPDEIIRVLRENAEWCDANEYEAPLCMGDNQREAASLLESQQSRIAELEVRVLQKTNEADGMRANWYKSAENYQQKCRDMAELEAQLAASQRRELAAVEDMEHITSEIGECNWTLARDGEKVGSLHLGRCAVCSHKYCGDEDYEECKFEWRGPQEAGKGLEK